MEQLSFTQFVKEELVNNDYESEKRLKALLSAFIKINGTISYKNSHVYINLKNENGKIIRFIYENLKKLYNCEIDTTISTSKSKHTAYRLKIKNASAIIDDLKISFVEEKISRELVYNDDTISGYLAGAFLACGSINSPKTSNYHLELCVENDNYAKWLGKLFSRYRNTDITPKIISRREKYVIYLKASALIADYLIMIGAVSSCMEYENIRIDRDYTNNANRLLNLDTANMSRTVNKANEQIKDIKKIIKVKGLDSLKKEKLILLAKLRLENESSSYDELAEIMSEKLCKDITKSNINHLFRKLHDIANTL